AIFLPPEGGRGFPRVSARPLTRRHDATSTPLGARVDAVPTWVASWVAARKGEIAQQYQRGWADGVTARALGLVDLLAVVSYRRARRGRPMPSTAALQISPRGYFCDGTSNG